MKNEKLLNYALESLKKGISVIPVGKNKRPLIPWKEFQTRHATEEEVRGWFETLDDPQIAFVTGKISNILVVDCEKGADPSFLPQDTMIVKSGGDGYHYYYKFEEGINNKARIKELIDWRGEGGYIISPNSVSDKGEYVLLQDKPLLDFPKNLFQTDDIFSIPETGGGIRFEKKTLNVYTGFPKGQRNDEMARYIGYILTQIHPADWDTEAWIIITQANMLNTPPLSDRELRTTFESIKGIERRNNPLGHVRNDFTANSYTNTTYRKKEEQIDFDDDEIKHISEVAKLQEINQDDVYPLQMKCFDDAIIGGVCPGDVITIAGQPGHGKTTLCQDWTMSMVRGQKKAGALWFSYEVLVSHVWKKFQEMGMKTEDCAVIPAKHSTGNVAWIEKKIKEGKEKFGIKTVFIDHLGFLLPKTEGVMGKNLSANYSVFLTQIMRDLKTIAIKEEVIIFLPVHMKKPDYGKKRAEIEDIGHSAGPAQESDLVFLIEREKDKSEDSNSYYTGLTKISLVKNRKTGITVIGRFNMVNGRFAYDDSVDKANNFFDTISRMSDEEREYENNLEEKSNDKNAIEAMSIIQENNKNPEDLKDIIDDLWDEL